MENVNFDEIYKCYKEEYEKIFKIIYPENHAERFTEENQTLNFYNAIRSIYKDTIAWFEYPWRIDGVTFAEEKSSSKRFDGVVYVPELDSMFIVEAKCLRNKNKYEAMADDLCRILGMYGSECPEGKKPSDSFTEVGKVKIHTDRKVPRKVYAVILADFWCKSRSRTYRKIDKHWETEESRQAYGVKDNYFNFLEILKKAEAFGIIKTPECKALSLENKNLGEKYKLLTLIAEIKNPTEIYDFC